MHIPTIEHPAPAGNIYLKEVGEMRKLCTAILLIVCIGSVNASSLYQRQIDSLNRLIGSNPHDTVLADAYVMLSEYFGVTNIDTIYPLCCSAFEIIDRNLEKELDPKVRSRFIAIKVVALNNVAYFFIRKGETGKAIAHYDQVKDIAEEIGDKNRLAGYYMGVGYIYQDKGNIEKALEYYHNGLRIREEIGDQYGISDLLFNLAYIYQTQDDLPMAMEYIDRCLKINLELDEKGGIATCYAWLGYSHEEKGDFVKAVEVYKKALEIREEYGDVTEISYTLNKLGHCYYLMDRCSDANPCFQQSLKMNEESKFPTGLLETLYFMGLCALKEENYKLAKEYADRSMKIAVEIANPISIRDAARLLHLIHKKEGRYQKALEMYEMYIINRDSIKNEKTQKATIRQQMKYEFEKAQLIKEQEKKEAARIFAEQTARRDNLQHSVILIGMLILFGFVLLLGFVKVSVRMAEGIIFFSFLILFEFLLVLADPYIEQWTGGAPGYKLLFNAVIAAGIFPLHSFFEGKIKKRLLKT